jgi:DnaK suppressor protein
MHDPLSDFQREFIASALHSLKLELRDADALVSVHNALGRVHDAGFGRCGRCDADIPFDRLAAEPKALYCLACARATEAERAS